jgi:hypothetical protein
MKKLIVALATGLCIIVSASNTKAQDNELIQTLIQKYSAEYNVPTHFADAIIFVESRYNPKVRGQKGEYGLGQILCSTAKGLGLDKKCDSLKDPETNLMYTMMYLRQALDESNNDLCHAAAIYSSGSTYKPKRPTPYCRLVMARMN